MITIRTSILLFLPFYLSAQDDYCPCMDSYNFEEEVSGMMSSVSGDFSEFYITSNIQEAEINQSPVVPIFIIEEPEEYIEKPGITEEIQEENIVKNQAKKVRKSRKSFISGKKYPSKWKLKRKRRFKKYSGQCPMF